MAINIVTIEEVTSPIKIEIVKDEFIEFTEATLATLSEQDKEESSHGN